MEHYEESTASVVFTVVVVPVSRFLIQILSSFCDNIQLLGVSKLFLFDEYILGARLDVMGAKTELAAGDPPSTFGVAAFDK